MGRFSPKEQARAFVLARPSLHRRVLPLARWPRPLWGTLRRQRPFSANYGFGRGTPADRGYIERFLSDHAADVHGRVLEVKDSAYTRRFGGEGLERADVVDVDGENPEATIVADLGEPGALPAASYDCFILTQTLQLIPDLDAALANAYRSLRPGGCLLLTVPAVSRVNPDINDLWRFLPSGLEVLLTQRLPDAEISVAGYGNLVASIAFLHGIAAEELRPRDLRPYDPHFPVIVGARVRRPAS